MSKPHHNGGFTASVSIHSGSGMASNACIMRFVPSFPSRRAALRYAASEGMAWAQAR